MSNEDLKWMRAALAQAREAYERGDWPTGAVLVRDGQLLASGQNRQNTRRNFTLHAETEAIHQAFEAHGPDAVQGATLYSTMEPCPMCAGTLRVGGVGRLVLGLRYARLHRPDIGEYSIESFCRLTAYKLILEDGLLEDECLELNRLWGKFKIVAPSGE